MVSLSLSDNLKVWNLLLTHTEATKKADRQVIFSETFKATTDPSSVSQSVGLVQAQQSPFFSFTMIIIIIKFEGPVLDNSQKRLTDRQTG